MKDSINIAIAGATGYIGLELIKILSKHPRANIIKLCATQSVGKTINYFDKSIKKRNLPKITKLEDVDWNSIHVLFTALPNGEAHKIAKVLPKKTKLIDVASGTGDIAQLYLNAISNVGKVCCVDSNKEMLNVSKKKVLLSSLIGITPSILFFSYVLKQFYLKLEFFLNLLD